MTTGTIQIVTTKLLGPGEWNPQEGRYTLELRNRLVGLGDLPTNESFDRVRAEAARILSSCLPPGTIPDRRTGLVVGCVQSGKTMSITTVTALARDNNFRLIVVLAGVAKNLVQQTQERLEEHLGTENWLVLQNPALRDKNDLVACASEWRNARIRSELHRGVLCVVMKHKTHIENLTNLLRGVDLADTNALIFDDEADQAGLNTKPDSGMSPIYSAIGGLRGVLPRHTFLQYTATPQAPLLISLLDSPSPDFADTIEPGDGYVGSRDFFVDHPNLVEDIIDEEGDADDGPPESLMKCLRFFFLGVAATRVLALRDPTWAKERHRSMLVHPSRMVAPHRDHATIIEDVRRDWTNLLSREEGDEERQELLKDFEVTHTALKETFSSLPMLDELIEQLTLQISRAKVTIVNKDGSEVPWKRHDTHILVGGQKLDRGYTVKGLTVTHMARDSGAGNYDTIQQRARFFGYKRKYLGLCRVFLQPDVHEAFQHYAIHEDVLRDALRRHRGKSLKTWQRVFHLERGYRLTRANVHVEDYFRPSRGDWFKQQGPHLGTTAIITDNNGTIERFVERIRAQPDEAWSRAGHWSSIATIADIQALLDEIVPCVEFDFSSLLVAQFALDFVANNWREPDAKIYLMAWSKEPRKRTPREFTELVELHQGASSSDIDGAYPGDTAVRDEDHVTLQIHRVQITPRGENAETTATGPLVLAFALRLPSYFTAGGFVFQPKQAPRLT